MRITFLCGSLEPGRDGVGDYVRRYATRLEQMGHSVQLIALADRFVSRGMSHSMEWPAGGMHRQGRSAWEQDELDSVEACIRGFGPHVLSLQLVCYAFADRGIMLHAARRLQRLSRLAALRHLMLHELWIGENAGATWRTRLVGNLQRWCVLRAVAAWQPHHLHTNSMLYVELLRRAGIAANRLPLPGNIEPDDMPAEQARAALLTRLGYVAPGTPAPCLVGVFGTIHPEWSDPAPISALGAALHNAGRQMILLQFGRAGRSGEKVWSELARQLSPEIQAHALGAVPADEVASILAALDLGLATSPWALIEKSGTVAAFLERGIPVLATRHDYHLRKGPTPEPQPHPLLFRLNEYTLRKLTSHADQNPDGFRSQDPFRALVEELEISWRETG